MVPEQVAQFVRGPLIGEKVFDTGKAVARRSSKALAERTLVVHEGEVGGESGHGATV